MKIFENNTLAIGETPLIKLNSIKGTEKNNILVKVEGRNPAYSVKCRVGAYILNEAIKNGELKPGMSVLEATSGNTGIGLAFAGAALGYEVAIVMPDNMSLERRLMMKAFGAKLILTDGTKGMAGAVAEADKMLKENPGKYYLANQFRNPYNPLVHEKTTGPEILRDTDGCVDMVVCGIGTGGTISGIGRFLKEKAGKNVVMVGVEPSKSPVITQKINGERLKPGSHNIQGIGAGFIPEVLDLSTIDHMELVDDAVALDYSRLLAKAEGIICGISSGAAVAAALAAADKLGMTGKNIVVILPDSGERYLSSGLFN
ncbi:cysteine synthase A [Seleniivibrio woodruffii]|uniref:cysteine synthase A n=1 Tax=Seleniivibrio woodruffii TaxID=1078050 RepID=UPI00240922F8|nr:cysteine synthase A [Seleniivibrio woodruffii]